MEKPNICAPKVGFEGGHYDYARGVCAQESEGQRNESSYTPLRTAGEIFGAILTGGGAYGCGGESGCAMDTDCGGILICEEGDCVPPRDERTLPTAVSNSGREVTQAWLTYSNGQIRFEEPIRGKNILVEVTNESGNPIEGVSVQLFTDHQYGLLSIFDPQERFKPRFVSVSNYLDNIGISARGLSEGKISRALDTSHIKMGITLIRAGADDKILFGGMDEIGAKDWQFFNSLMPAVDPCDFFMSKDEVFSAVQQDIIDRTVTTTAWAGGGCLIGGIGGAIVGFFGGAGIGTYPGAIAGCEAGAGLAGIAVTATGVGIGPADAGAITSSLITWMRDFRSDQKFTIVELKTVSLATSGLSTYAIKIPGIGGGKYQLIIPVEPDALHVYPAELALDPEESGDLEVTAQYSYFACEPGTPIRLHPRAYENQQIGCTVFPNSLASIELSREVYFEVTKEEWGEGEVNCNYTVPETGWTIGKDVPLGDRSSPECNTPEQTMPYYTGPAGTEGVGPCQAGEMICRNGAWEVFNREVTPRPEACNDGVDNDCDGERDEECGQPLECEGSYYPIDGKCCTAGELGGLMCIVDSFRSPGGYPYGLAWDGQNLWNTDPRSMRIYKISTSGQIIDSFVSPVDNPHDLTWDGQHLWVVDSARNESEICKLSAAGQVVDAFYTPAEGLNRPAGLTWDGRNFWNAVSDGKVYKLTTNGQIVDFFEYPEHHPEGLTWDGQNLWGSYFGNKRIYKLNAIGQVINFFRSPEDIPHGLTWNGRYIWNADANSDKIYKLEIIE